MAKPLRPPIRTPLLQGEALNRRNGSTDSGESAVAATLNTDFGHLTRPWITFIEELTDAAGPGGDLEAISYPV